MTRLPMETPSRTEGLRRNEMLEPDEYRRCLA